MIGYVIIMLVATIYIADTDVERACRMYLNDSVYHEVRDDLRQAIDDVFARHAEELGIDFVRLSHGGKS